MNSPEGRQALGREIKRALSAGGLSVAEASRKMGVEPKRLYRWINGEVSPRLVEVEKLALAIEQELTVRLGPDTETEPPEPEWVERLLAGVIALEDKEGVTAEELAAAEAKAAAHLVVARQRRPPPRGGGGGSASNA